MIYSESVNQKKKTKKHYYQPNMWQYKNADATKQTERDR